MINKQKAPLFERLIEHAESKPASFHVPGHKSGQGVAQPARPYYEAMLRLDMTEISGLDDLHQPEEAILEAQRLAADCFGAEESFFLVNGSTVGNLAMILSVCRRGDLLLVQRDVHKSVIHGLMLAGARAVFLTPEVDPETGLTLGLEAELVERALHKYPEAKGLLLTRPSYYGAAMPLEAIVRILHARNKPLLVDEAHGAHFGFHPALPKSALSYGADAVVQSTHKLLTSMTMGAMLHVQGDLIERKEIKLYLKMLQSSSPSYPLMASLDLSRMQMHTEGKRLLERGITVVERFKESIRGLARFELLAAKLEKANGRIAHDPFKVILKDGEGRMSGFGLKNALEARGCFVELADPQAVLLVFSLASSDEDVNRLLAALEAIASTTDSPAASPIMRADLPTSDKSSKVSGLSESVSFDEHVYRHKRTVHLPLDEAAGQLSAEMIVPYPPGIPVLCPGERITREVVIYLKQLVTMGARIHGLIAGEAPKLPVLLPGKE